jgi:hypothetical protein
MSGSSQVSFGDEQPASVPVYVKSEDCPVYGVFTIIVLMREPVKQLFEANPPAAATSVKQ